MTFYRSYGAPAASRGSDGDVYDAGQKVFENVAPHIGIPLTSEYSARAARDAFFQAAYPGLDKNSFFSSADKVKIPGAAPTLDSAIAGKHVPGADIAGLNGACKGMLDLSGQVGDPTFSLFKAIVDILSELFSSQAATDLVCGVLPPLELYNQTIEAAYESTKLMAA
jgi:hypothetical protein